VELVDGDWDGSNVSRLRIEDRTTNTVCCCHSRTIETMVPYAFRLV